MPELKGQMIQSCDEMDFKPVEIWLPVSEFDTKYSVYFVL